MTFRSIKEFLVGHWIGLITGAILALGAVAIVAIGDLTKIAQFGDFVAGFSAALAFLWLIAGLKLQANELKLQRKELQLQRAALENQTKELRNSARFSSLSQIATILERATQRVAEGELGIKDPSEISIHWHNGMRKWNTILESTDPNVVQSEFLKWSKIEALTRGYIASISVALKIYLEHYLDSKFEPRKSNEEFLYVYSSWMTNAPYLLDHAGTATMLAHNLFLMEPGLKSMRFAGFCATAKISGDEIFKDGALKAMRDELEQKKWIIPAIAKT